MILNVFSSKQLKKIATTVVALLLISSFAFSQDRTPASAYNEGLAELKAKNYETGLTLMEEALSLSEEGKDDKVIKLAMKNGAVAAYNLAKDKKDAGANDEALAFYEKGIELNPDYVANYTGKAAVLEVMGDKIAALEAYITSGTMQMEKKPKRAEKMINRAENIVGKFYTSKSYDEAIAAGNKFLELKEGNHTVHYYIARALIEKNDNETALTHADQAITLAADAVEDKYYIAKGLALENMKRNAEAVEVFKMVTGEKYKKQAEYKIQTLGSK